MLSFFFSVGVWHICFFQAEDGIRGRDVTGVRRVLFRSFRHSTCSLSVSHQYLALDGIYHPIWSALPSKPTLRKRTKRRGPKTGLSPSLVLAFLPELDPVPAFAPLDYNSRRILRLSSSLFSRPYWGNPGWFLFLGLVICLNSAGPLA